MADTKRIIRRKSLGRIALIGSLYNGIKDTFCGTNILKAELPNDSVNRADIYNTELLYEYEDSYEKKFNKLNVEDELKLSILTDLFDLEGSGKYLSDVKESFRSVKGTLICKMTSVVENLNIYHDDVKACISTDGFNNPDATHVVIGIKWGAAIMASFEYKNTKEENKSQVKEELNSYFENISRKGYVDVEEGSKNMSDFSINLFGDVIPHNMKFPHSFNEASKAMAVLLSHAKQSNDGKGIPIEYTLYPLSELAKLLTYNTTVNSKIMEFSEKIILKVVQIYDSLSESKQRLNDLYNDAHSISDFIPDKIFDEIRNHVQQAKKEERRFSQELAKSLVKARSGKSRINEFENKIKIFQNGILSKGFIMAFINQHQSVSMKANLIFTLKAKNVEYLSKYSNVGHVLFKYSNCHVYIFIDNDEFIINGNSSPEYNMFQDLYNSDEGSSKFFIADPKICAGINSLGFPVIHHYINGRLESKDYYNDNKVFFMSNLVKFNPVPCIKPKHKLSNKTRLAIPCPNTNCPTATTISNWKCFKCRQDIEYGYNQHLYCGCGESKITNCKFRCNNPYHSEGYVPFELNRLINLLPSTPPPEEINILLLGETGVGKSTFINAFVNYHKFNTLNDAKSGNVEVLISSKFTIIDENHEMQTIKIGNDDSNEKVENVGMSSTQECKSYVFSVDENRVVRLIDTPGIGVTRGLDQDKKNFENILKFISYYQHLNGIYILLKPNNSRLNIIFRFCIQELLSHLHKNAKDNIVFCFTNARGSFYRPGDTLPALKEQLEELKKRSNVEIKINYNTIYCFDNESFRYLAAIKENVKFTSADEQSFVESWKKSVDESLRLIQYLITCSTHKVMDTLSLNNSRNMVIILSKHLAEMGQLIQTNIMLIKEKQNEVENSNQAIEQLKDRIYISHIDLEPKTLGHFRTVCTSTSCVTILKIEQTNISKIDYKTHCHPRCNCNIPCDLVNDPMLRSCAVMNKNGNCGKCGCYWNKHTHITYENEIITKRIVDQNVKLQISKKQSDQETKKAIIKEFQIRVNQLQKEQQKINKISLKFAQFLRQNAIAAFNDAYADYFDHFIKEEKIMKNADPINYDEEIIKGLETTKKNYLKQIDFIKQAISNNDPSISPISQKDIAELEQELYNLPIIGR